MTARTKKAKQTAAEIAESVVERRIARLLEGPDQFCGYRSGADPTDAQELIDAVRESEPREYAGTKAEGALWDAGFLLGVAVGRRLAAGRAS